MSLQTTNLLWSLCSHICANDTLYLQPLPSAGTTASAPPQLHLRSSSIRFSQGACNLDPSHAQFTVGFVLLGESNAPADPAGGGA